MHGPMRRPAPAAKSARHFANLMTAAGTSALAFAADALLGKLVQLGIYDQAMRDNRQMDRARKRSGYSARNAEAGLNGKRAVARRLRQIERGSLRVENGLVTG
ncbi:hypothetical protein J6524_04860 [Bradyrhizobium sp. WSM 1738]|uniref:hypothetical protein n=1 Tax=Bradyrhizobium hereditatis TaxID=2821405 RepID=UPI001CE33476|nr:hypothetical protein [Bradyrhizobium hereditatis]MCA6114259.1 hypothetical protein [Bradyrhizobium hereditatis]